MSAKPAAAKALETAKSPPDARALAPARVLPDDPRVAAYRRESGREGGEAGGGEPVGADGRPTTRAGRAKAKRVQVPRLAGGWRVSTTFRMRGDLREWVRARADKRGVSFAAEMEAILEQAKEREEKER